MHLGHQHAGAAAGDELQHRIVGAQAEQLPGAARDAPQVVPQVAEVQLLVLHSKVCLQGSKVAIVRL